MDENIKEIKPEKVPMTQEFYLPVVLYQEEGRMYASALYNNKEGAMESFASDGKKVIVKVILDREKLFGR